MPRSSIYVVNLYIIVQLNAILQAAADVTP